MTDALDPTALLAEYDAQVRGYIPEGATVERDGPVLRHVGRPGGGFIGYQDVSGLSSDELDTLIARQRDFFAARGERVEWKYHAHDLPVDLPDRLRVAGFEPEEEETVLIGLAASLAAIPSPVPVRETRDRADFDRIAEMKTVVWGRDLSWIADMLEQEADLRVFVAELDDRVVSAAWLSFVPGTRFAGLWGGSTLKEYRGRGIYRALVAARAALATARGYTYLQVDASPDSRPILQRLGFVAITTTTPYVFTP